MAPLREQHESKYVTDPSLWGKLVFDRANLQPDPEHARDFSALVDVIESYHSHWLDRNEDRLAELIDDDIVRFRQGRAAYGRDDVIARIRQESRGERPRATNRRCN
jgi:hypothetical protein